MSSNNHNRVYLDTETTGLHPEEGDEILSLTIVDANGRLLFDERFKPKHKKEWPEAQAVNHISPDDVEHLTTIDAYMEQICRILDRIADEIVGYNIAFDIGFLKAAGATINPDAAIIDTMHFKVADSRRNRLAQDRDRPRNITLRYDDDNRDSQ